MTWSREKRNEYGRNFRRGRLQAKRGLSPEEWRIKRKKIKEDRDANRWKNYTPLQKKHRIYYLKNRAKKISYGKIWWKKNKKTQLKRLNLTKEEWRMKKEASKMAFEVRAKLNKSPESRTLASKKARLYRKNLTKKQKEARASYKKAWLRSLSPSKIAERKLKARNRYWANVEVMRQRSRDNFVKWRKQIKEYRLKNAERLGANRRKKYRENAEFFRARNSRRYWRDIDKTRLDDKKYRDKNRERIRGKAREYRKLSKVILKQKAYSKMQINNLSDTYIKCKLRGSGTLKGKDFPQELVELTRKHLQLRRLILKNKRELQNENSK